MSRTQTVTATRVFTDGTPGRLRQNGPAIRSLREKDGWHQPEFARKVGMSQAALSNIEREKRSARPATIHKIARALRVPVAAITREYDEMEGPAALFGTLCVAPLSLVQEDERVVNLVRTSHKEKKNDCKPSGTPGEFPADTR
jgi:transcriptional regulator with XRE-family HTH domain